MILEQHDKPGGLMRTNIPAFRLPGQVIDEEIATIVDMGVDVRYNTPVTSLRALLEQGFDAVFIGTVRREARTWMSRGGTTAIGSTSASTGWSRSRSATSTRSASEC